MGGGEGPSPVVLEGLTCVRSVWRFVLPGGFTKAVRGSPLPSQAFPTLLPTALPGVPHPAPHRPPRGSPPRSPPPSPGFPRRSPGFPALLLAPLPGVPYMSPGTSALDVGFPPRSPGFPTLLPTPLPTALPGVPHPAPRLPPRTWGHRSAIDFSARENAAIATKMVFFVRCCGRWAGIVAGVTLRVCARFPPLFST